MREVDALENPTIEEPLYKFSDEFEKRTSIGHEYEEKNYQNDKFTLKDEDHKQLHSRIDTLTQEVSDLRLKLDDRDAQIYELRKKLEQERK